MTHQEQARNFLDRAGEETDADWKQAYATQAIGHALLALLPTEDPDWDTYLRQANSGLGASLSARMRYLEDRIRQLEKP